MSHDDEPPAVRRRFLAQGAAAAGALLAGGQARSDEAAPPAIPEWMKTPGADVGSQTYGHLPSPAAPVLPSAPSVEILERNRTVRTL
jgi:hypothetical protein